MKRFLRGLAIFLWLASFAVACLWFQDPVRAKCEPLLQILALLAFGVTAVAGWLERRKIVPWVKRIRPPKRDVALVDGHRKFICELNDKKVEYLIIGGFAGLFYGRVVQTHDLDVWIGHHPYNHQRLASALRGLGYDPSIIKHPQLNSGFVPVARAGGTPIDLYTFPSMNGQDFYLFYSRREKVIINELPVSVISQRDNRQQTAYKFDPVKIK